MVWCQDTETRGLKKETNYCLIGEWGEGILLPFPHDSLLEFTSLMCLSKLKA